MYTKKASPELLSLSAHRKKQRENSVSLDEIHTENTANQKGKTAISPSSYQSSQEHVAEVQNSTADNV